MSTTYWAEGYLDAIDTAGGVFAVQNPQPKEVIMLRCIINVTTASTAACTIDIGVAADAETSDDSIVAGLDVNSEGITEYSTPIICPFENYFTASMASGATEGLEGKYYIEYKIA